MQLQSKLVWSPSATKLGGCRIVSLQILGLNSSATTRVSSRLPPFDLHELPSLLKTVDRASLFTVLARQLFGAIFDYPKLLSLESSVHCSCSPYLDCVAGSPFRFGPLKPYPHLKQNEHNPWKHETLSRSSKLSLGADILVLGYQYNGQSHEVKHLLVRLSISLVAYSVRILSKSTRRAETASKLSRYQV